MRLFLAINLEPGVRRALVEATSALHEAAPMLTWVDESRLHLTLKFLGEQPDGMAGRVGAMLDRVAAKHHRFPIHIRQVGAFPNFRRARVVWMGVEQNTRLELLHHDVEVACDTLGFELDGRPFRPHLTLTRVKDRVDEESLRKLSRAGKRVDFDGEADVESIDLMKSELGAGGSRYQRLHASPLKVR